MPPNSRWKASSSSGVIRGFSFFFDLSSVDAWKPVLSNGVLLHVGRSRQPWTLLVVGWLSSLLAGQRDGVPWHKHLGVGFERRVPLHDVASLQPLPVWQPPTAAGKSWLFLLPLPLPSFPWRHVLPHELQSVPPGVLGLAGFPDQTWWRRHPQPSPAWIETQYRSILQ